MTPREVVQHYGNETKTAAALGKSPRCITNWVKEGKISYWNQCAIQTISGGALKATPERANRRKA